MRCVRQVLIEFLLFNENVVLIDTADPSNT